MYAKLVFNGGTTCGEAVRDITRLITESNAGTASLNNLEFINLANCELFAGQNSGWSLHSSYTLGTGAVSSTDSHYVLQGTTLTGKTKYAGIQINSNYSSFADTGFALGLSNVLDPGTATEVFGWGYQSTASGYADVNGIMPSSTFYIWAEPRKIVIMGKDGNSRNVIQTQLEFAETASTTYNNLPPTTFFQWTHDDSTASTYIYAYRGDSGFSSTGDSRSCLQMLGSFYSYHPDASGVVRSLHFHAGEARGNSLERIAMPRIYLEDGTTIGTLNSTIGVGQMNDGRDLPNVFTEAFGGGRISQNTAPSTIKYGAPDLVHRDASGNKAVPLRPIWFEVPGLNSEVFRFSGVSNIWWAPNGLGAINDTITVGSDVYQYVPYTPYNGGALMIKRI